MDKHEDRQHLSYGLSAFVAITTCLAQGVLILVAGKFQSVFDGFGAQLPLLTRAFLPGAPTYYIIAIVSLIAYLSRHYQWFPTRMPFILFGLCAMIEGPVFVIAMYLPIFQLGAVVSG